ncbi:MAG TPA: kelch repeat-containing protein [Kofleriaceae bacterium]
MLCVPAACGDGKRDPGEVCDDGNNISGDGCPADCSPPCGDRILDPGEACDDGNHIDGDGCSADCHSTEVCGNGVPDIGEQCDEGGLPSRSVCSSRCMLDVPKWTTTLTAPPAGGGLMAYDAARGVVVLYSNAKGPSQTLEWDGVAWLPTESYSPYVSLDAAGMIYDPTRSRVVLFGDFDTDYSPSGKSAWEWDGNHWTEQTVLTTPPPLHNYAIAYDSARHKVVLFGGETPNTTMFGAGFQDRTWEWDGTAWQEIATPARPPRRITHAMTYDSTRGKVVLYGGQGADASLLHDTWEYDGATWTQRSESGPPRSWFHHMVFDAARGKVVSFGGFGEQGFNVVTPGDTWEWDGAQWEMKVETAAPQARFWPAMTYDIVRQRVVLFGGSSNGPDIADSSTTWTWDGGHWIDEATRGRPPARSHHAMVYETRSTTTMMFGGLDGAGARCLDDTWTWDGSAWRQAEPTRSPPPRMDHAMAYDLERARTVLFGGADLAGPYLDDTWEWDGTGWLARTPAVRPPARKGHAMVYDAARQQLLVIGGDARGSLLFDQWVWDGNHWTDVTPVQHPSARSDFALAYDSRRQRVVLFGGRSGSTVLGDTWEWDGTQWVNLTANTEFGPAARFGHTLTYDTALRSIVLFGGYGETASLSDTWVWDGNTWTDMSLLGAVFEPVAPPARHHHAMVYDIARGGLVLLAGNGSDDLNSTTGLDDLWSLRFGNPIIHDGECYTGFDGDGDGKIGCTDQDCAGACARCGDGRCDAAESCRLCPADCGACQICGDLHCDPGETCASCPGDCGPCP